MANYCNNHIQIFGTPKNIQQVKKIFEVKEFNLVETGDKLFNIESKDFYKDYGTKWFDVSYIDADENSIIISGDSAWSPPTDFFLKLSKKYNLEITLEYEEQGCNIGGTHKYHNGTVTEQDDTTYQLFKYKEDGIYDIINNYLDYLEDYNTFEEWKEQTIDKEVIELLTDEENKELEDAFNEAK